MKRFTVVMTPEEIDREYPYASIWVEYYAAVDFGHAEEQALDANPPGTKIIAVTRDPNPSL